MDDYDKATVADRIEMLARLIGEPGNQDDLTAAVRGVASALYALADEAKRANDLKEKLNVLRVP